MKRWEFMVVRRYYHNGRYDAQIISSEDFHREDYPENKEQYRQEFYPCTDFEKAVKALDFARLFKKTKEPVK